MLQVLAHYSRIPKDHMTDSVYMDTRAYERRSVLRAQALFRTKLAVAHWHKIHKMIGAWQLCRWPQNCTVIDVLLLAWLFL